MLRKRRTRKLADGKSGSFSRRSFLKSMGLGAAVAAAPARLLPAQGKKASPLRGPGAVPVELTVNGRKVRREVEPRVTLLDLLRDRLDVTGPKKVCDRAECGACSVIRDGKLIYACTALAIDCEGSEITTPEGLAPEGEMHAAARAFVECDGFQCGFCTPGQVIALKALLDKHPDPTPEQVRIGMSGNLCRCGAYVKIRRAATTAAAMLAGGGR